MGVLPRAGGVLDQDYWEMTMVRVGLQAFDEYERKEMKKK